MSDEEYISDEEFLANLRSIDNEKLIQSLQNCGHDGYYNDLYYPIVEEIKRRLSLSPSAEPERTAKVYKKQAADRLYQFYCGECCQMIDCSYYEDYKSIKSYCGYCGVKLDWSDDE